MLIRVFVGFDSREVVAYHVLCQSILERASVPVCFIPIALNTVESVFSREPNPLQSTQFSFSRFLVPSLSDYSGWSLYVDCDMLFRRDIGELWSLRDDSCAVMCCQHDYAPKAERKFFGQGQSRYARKNWSSLMLFNNSACRSLTTRYVNTASGLDLHQFRWIDEQRIGAIPLTWNHLVGEYAYDPAAANVHFTQGGPYIDEVYARSDYADEWFATRARVQSARGPKAAPGISRLTECTSADQLPIEHGVDAMDAEHAAPTFSADYQRVHQHVFAQIEAAEAQLEPFPHCYVRNVFPDDFYQTLINKLPSNQHYHKFPAPYESRLFFNLSPTEVAGLDPFWTEFERWIHSQAFLDCMARRFVPYLQRMHRHRTEQLAAHGVADRVNIGCRTLVTRDYGDYSLGPHTDAPAKFITALFYLPSDERFSAFGTSLYRPKDLSKTDWRSRHFDHQDFESVRTLPNLPNSVLIFAKTDNSFHGVSPGNYSNDGRNLMMWIPEVGLTQRNWSPRHLPRSYFVPQNAAL